jgi:branched-subunit amino acid transport protein
MNPQVKRILKWAVLGALVAVVVNIFVTTGESTSVRVCFGLLVAGAGAVTGALLCANFTADEEKPAEGHAPGHEQHH